MNLFEIASSYSSFGYHRTGSQSQLKTEGWLQQCLKKLTNRVECFDYDYQHFEARTEVFINKKLIPSMALYYEAVGELRDCRNFEVTSVEISADETSDYEVIKQKQKQAGQRKCEVLVVATWGANDSLRAFNVTPLLKDTLPTVMVPGSEHENLHEGTLSLNYSAELSQRKAKNIIACFGDHSTDDPVVITTPISGWFECAGERGTGIALAIALAKKISKTKPVRLVLASGHELGYLGGFKYTAGLKASPAAVIHIGSCLATHGSALNAWSNIEDNRFDQFASYLQQVDIPITKVAKPSERTDWVGEAECWSHFNCPMISIAGDNPVFHTPEDRIAAATNPEVMAEMFDVLSDSMEVFLYGVANV